MPPDYGEKRWPGQGINPRQERTLEQADSDASKEGRGSLRKTGERWKGQGLLRALRFSQPPGTKSRARLEAATPRDSTCLQARYQGARKCKARLSGPHELKPRCVSRVGTQAPWIRFWNLHLQDFLAEWPNAALSLNLSLFISKMYMTVVYFQSAGVAVKTD